MATPFDHLKILIVYFNLLTLKTLLFTQKCLNILYRTGICANYGLFFPKFGYQSNALCSLKNSDSIFEFYNPENPIIYIKIVTISH